MIDGVLFVLTFIAAVGAGLAAGVFFAFDTSILAALRRLPAPQGIAAMQSINVTIVRGAFMLDLFGTGLLMLVLAVIGLVNVSQPYGPYLLAGGLVYFIGTILLTMVYNVPRNNALDRADPSSSDGAEYWARYLREWGAANIVRTLTCTGGSILMILALLAD